MKILTSPIKAWRRYIYGLLEKKSAPAKTVDIMQNDKNYFIVTSPGRTASYWLAASLHEHANIICGHSLQTPPVPDYTKPMQWSDVQSILAETGVAHWKFLSGSKRVHPNEYFDRLEQEGNAKFYGCVHTYALHGLIECFAIAPQNRAYKIVNLTRHPINRATSWRNRALEEWKHSPGARDFWVNIYNSSPPHKTLADYARRTCHLDPDDDKVISFICATIDVAAETTGLNSNYLTVPMERLVSDPQFYIWFLKKITANDISIDLDYIEKVYSKGKLNPSKQITELPQMEYRKWEVWEKSIFSEACARWPIQQSFSPLGYDLTFLAENLP